MRILSIETSCDETAVSIVEARGGVARAEFRVLSNVVHSQAKLHEEFGGVFPSLAKREHAKNMPAVLKTALKEAGLWAETSGAENRLSQKTRSAVAEIFVREVGLADTLLTLVESIENPNIDSIAVTHGPGLEPALWVGINTAKALASAWSIPVIPVDHMEGHVLASLLPEIKKKAWVKLAQPPLPAVALLISGGHTQIALMEKDYKYTVLGETRDDAVGEAFDKVARMLGLPYPGGPEISRLAKLAPKKHTLTLPRPMLNSSDFDFSFSGLKTAVLYTIRDAKRITPMLKKEIAREFEDSATEVLTTKTIKAMLKHKARSVILGGGVSSNEKIRESFTKLLKQERSPATLFVPSKGLSTDNALMIALAGYIRASISTRSIKKTRASIDKITADGRLRLS